MLALKLNRVLLVVLVSSLPWPAWAAVAEAPLPLVEVVFPDLEPILRNALNQSPRMLSRNLERLQAEGMAGVAASRRLPNVSAAYQFNRQRDDRTFLDDWVDTDKVYYDFRITQPVYHWGAVKAGVEVGKVQEALSANNMAEAYRLLALEIRSAYLQLVINKAAAANARYEAGLARRRLEAIEARVRAGGDPAAMTQPALLAVSEADLAVDRSEQALEISTRQFARLTGASDFASSLIPEEIPRVAPPPAPDTRPFRMNFVEKGGYAETNQLKAAKLELERELLNEKIDRVRLRPKLDAVAGIMQDEISYDLDVSRRDRYTSVYVGVRVSWSIFDGFATWAQLSATRARIRLMEQRLAETETDLLNAAEDACKELEFAARGLDHAETRFTSSQTFLSAAKSNFERGRASELDVQSAQAAANFGRLNVFRARASYLGSLSSFLSTVNADPLAESAAQDILNR